MPGSDRGSGKGGIEWDLMILPASERNGRRHSISPARNAGGAPVVIVAEDKAWCSECYLAALKKMQKKARQQDFKVDRVVS